MTKTSVRQKIFLVVFGIILTIVALELLLRLGGFLFHARQEMANKASFAADEVRILCLGESTTALGNDNSYPSQLEEFLNQRSGKKRFKVINKGEISKTSRDLLDHLESNLARYRPQVVIGMIGINDTKDTPGFVSRGRWDAFLNKWRVHHLFVLLKQHLERTLAERRMKTYAASKDAQVKEGAGDAEAVQEKDYPKIVKDLQAAEQGLVQLEVQMARADLSDSERALITRQAGMFQAVRARDYKLVGIYHLMRKDYPFAEKALSMAFKLSPDDPGTLLEIGRLFKELKKFDQALTFVARAVALAPDKPVIQLELGRIYAEMGNKEAARAVFQKVVAMREDNGWTYIEIGNWFKENNYLEDAEKALTLSYELNSLNYTMIEKLAETCRLLGHTDKAKAFDKEARFLKDKMSRYAPETVQNYNEIVRRVRASGAAMIVMQYPLRKIDTLQAVFEDQGKIIFIENRENFLTALKAGSFAKYFADNFAGDFGHCTDAGNRLIAENLAEVVWSRAVVSGRK